MTPASASTQDRAKRRRSTTPAAAKLFYPVAAIVIAIVAFVGFSRFYLHGGAYPHREITPPIKWLVIAHGVVMSAWLVMLILQPTLIAVRSYKLHMKLGKIGAGLAALTVILGFSVAVRSAQVTPPDVEIWGMSPKAFLAPTSLTIAIFGACVTLGVIFRRKPQIHRTMMILGTLFMLAAAFDRIDPLKNLYVGTIWADLFGPFFLALVLGALLLAVRSALARKLDVVFAVGLALLVAASIFIMKLGPTSTWDSIASVFVK